MNIKVNDTVLVIAGDYENRKQGRVLKTYPKMNKVIVEGVNLVTKHKKARKANETSRKVEEEAPIDASNVMVVCDKCKKPTRVGHAVVDGKKVRVCKHTDCGAVLDKVFQKKTKAKAEETEAPKKRTRKRSKKAEESAEVVENAETVETVETAETPAETQE